MVCCLFHSWSEAEGSVYFKTSKNFSPIRNLYILLVGTVYALGQQYIFLRGRHFSCLIARKNGMTKEYSQYSCKRAAFWSPNPGWHLFLKPDLGPNAKFTEWVKICATAGHWWRSKNNLNNSQLIIFIEDLTTSIASAVTAWRQKNPSLQKILYAGSKSARNIAINLSPNPARHTTLTDRTAKKFPNNSTYQKCITIPSKHRLLKHFETYRKFLRSKPASSCKQV